METVRSVLIVGGGCGGLSAAHELVKLNERAAETGLRFQVDVVERGEVVGGKCASQYDPGPGGVGRWPGEHGFRFFPQFYQHLTQTLREIPYPDPDSPGTVFQNLRAPRYGGVAYDGHLTRIPRRAAAASLEDALDVLLGPLVRDLSAGDLARYARHLLRFLSSCDARRAQWDDISWEAFLEFDQGGYTESGKRLLRLVPAVLSAMRARDSSARTIGDISLQVAFNFHPGDPDPKDGILAGPTSEVWLEPWRRFLESRGVRFHFRQSLVDLEIEHGRLQGLRFEEAGGRVLRRTADHTILAVPVEVVLRLLDERRLPGSTLQNLRTVRVPERWGRRHAARPASALLRTWTSHMAGLQYYLSEDVRIADGHLAFPASPWCITAVAQQQYWTGGLERWGIPHLRGILSVIVSDWDEPSPRTGRSARAHLAERDVDGLLREVWAQMQDGLGPDTPLDWDRVLHARLDRGLVVGLPEEDEGFNPTPLLVHPVGAARLRPDGTTGVAGLYVASDFNRTAVDLATMEGANEGGRQAVRAIAEVEHVDEAWHPWLGELDEGDAWRAVQRVDAALFRAGLPNLLDLDLADLLARIDRIDAHAPVRVLGQAWHHVRERLADVLADEPAEAPPAPEGTDLALLLRAARTSLALEPLRGRQDVQSTHDADRILRTT